MIQRSTMSSSSFNKGKEIVMVEGVFICETYRANIIEFETKTGAKAVRLPISQMPKPVEISDVITGECVALIPHWLAEKHGLPYEPYNIEEEEGGLEEKDWALRDPCIKIYELDGGRE